MLDQFPWPANCLLGKEIYEEFTVPFVSHIWARFPWSLLHSFLLVHLGFRSSCFFTPLPSMFSSVLALSWQFLIIIGAFCLDFTLDYISKVFFEPTWVWQFEGINQFFTFFDLALIFNRLNFISTSIWIFFFDFAEILLFIWGNTFFCSYCTYSYHNSFEMNSY